jgi:antitoxin component YwqK of YwqJK toxin-antitoxin module
MLSEDTKLPLLEDGYHTQYYTNEDSKNIYREFSTLNGELHGSFKQYTLSKVIIIKAHYDNGMLDGKYEEKYEDGTRKISGWFSDGEPHKKFLTYYDSGNIKTLSVFDRDGRRHGTTIEYFDGDKNQVKMRIKYQNGDKHGRATKHFYNGKLALEANFENDKLHGDYIRYYPTGIVRVQCEFTNGYLHGKYIAKYPSGEPLRVLFFNKGQLHGRALFLHQGNIPKASCEFSQGQLNGIYKSFDGNGKISEKKTYYENLLIDIESSGFSLEA